MGKIKIKKSKNLIYQDFSFLPDGTTTFRNPPSKSVLQRFEHYERKLILHFENQFITTIYAKNLEGERELFKIVQKLPEFIGKSYEEILNYEF